MSQHSLTLAGSLTPQSSTTSDESAPELIDAVTAVRAGNGDMASLLHLFRATVLYVEAVPTDDGRALPVVQREGLRWVPVFSSLQQLAACMVTAGRGDDTIDYGRISGADLLDSCLPHLPHGTGVVLDTISDHVFALPPVSRPEPLTPDA